MAAAGRGRPPKWGPAILTKAKQYLTECEDEYKIVEYGKGGQLLWDVNIPSIAGLARYLDVSRETIYAWGQNHTAVDSSCACQTPDLHDDFSDILRTLQAEQEKRLLQQGLAGNYNATITKLVLSKHGYRDSQDITSNGEALKPVVIDSTVAEKFTNAASEPTEDSKE